MLSLAKIEKSDFPIDTSSNASFCPRVCACIQWTLRLITLRWPAYFLLPFFFELTRQQSIRGMRAIAFSKDLVLTRGEKPILRARIQPIQTTDSGLPNISLRVALRGNPAAELFLLVLERSAAAGDRLVASLSVA